MQTVKHRKVLERTQPNRERTCKAVSKHREDLECRQSNTERKSKTGRSRNADSEIQGCPGTQTVKQREDSKCRQSNTGEITFLQVPAHMEHSFKVRIGDPRSIDVGLSLSKWSRQTCVCLVSVCLCETVLCALSTFIHREVLWDPLAYFFI